MLLRGLHHIVHYNHLSRLVLGAQVSLMVSIEVVVMVLVVLV